jgi:hypothetical protein
MARAGAGMAGSLARRSARTVTRPSRQRQDL